MDKYNGIKRAQSRSAKIEYEVVRMPPQKGRSNAKSTHNGCVSGQNSAQNDTAFTQGSAVVGFLVRCIICLLLILVCAVGKFSTILPAQQASIYIKDELSRDSMEEISKFIEEQAQNQSYRSIQLPSQSKYQVEQSIQSSFGLVETKFQPSFCLKYKCGVECLIQPRIDILFQLLPESEAVSPSNSQAKNAKSIINQ